MPLLDRTTEELTIQNLSSDDVWDHENGFHWHSSITRLGKLLAQFDLYKEVLDLPGDVFELGVFKAGSLIRFATFRYILENDYSRKIVGFDAFGKFPKSDISMQSELKFISEFETEAGDGLNLSEVQSIIDHKGFKNIDLVEGNVLTTLPKYIEQFPASRIALLHLDMDIKEPTEYALEYLYDRIVPGGLIIFDDYNSLEGVTDVADNFAANKGLQIVKNHYYSVPSFVRKPRQT